MIKSLSLLSESPYIEQRRYQDSFEEGRLLYEK